MQAATDWREALEQILDTKCALICTGFSPADVERDVLAMDSVEGLDFDWIVSPGENVFKSFKWEVADVRGGAAERMLIRAVRCARPTARGGANARSLE